MGPLRQRIVDTCDGGDLAVGFYLIPGFPDLDTSYRALKSLKALGCTFFEGAIPVRSSWSDETNEVIKGAHLIACQNGISSPRALEILQEFRPSLLVLYRETLWEFGPRLLDVLRGKADAILPEWGDLSELKEIALPCDTIALVGCVSVKDTEEEIQLACCQSQELIYLTIASTTGGRISSKNEIERALTTLKQKSDVPVLCGFGVRTPEHVKFLGSLEGCDAIVVGTAAIEALGRSFQEFVAFAESILRAAKRLKRPRVS